MIRSSSTITSLLDNQKKKAFKEIQNLTRIDQNEEKIDLTSADKKLNESMTSDEINNSENTRIIEFGPRNFKIEDTYTSEETLSEASDLNQTISIDHSDSFCDIIKEFLISNNGTYIIEEEYFHISQDLFLKSIEVVETYNQVICSIYSSEIPIEKLNLKFFIRSVLNSDQKYSYFNKVVQSLIQVLIHSEINAVTKIQMFNVNLIYLMKHIYLSDKTKILILIKIFETYKNNHIPATDKSILLTKCFGQIEQQIDSVSDLNELKTGDKINLINHLIEILISKKSNYHSKLEELEKNIILQRSKLDSLKNKFELNKLKLDSISRFLNENDESVIKSNLIDLKNKINLHETTIEEFKNKIESMFRCEPFSSIDFDDQNFSFYFWRFNCLKNYLCIEKRFKSDNFTFKNESFDFTTEKSEWFIIRDRTSIIELMKRITTSIRNLNFEDTMLKIIACTLLNSSFIDGPENGVNKTNEQYHDHDSTFISFLVDFKQRIIEANFLFFKTYSDRKNDLITSYSINDAYYSFNQILSEISTVEKEKRIEKYIELTIALYKMINHKFLTYKFPSNFGSLWLNMVRNSKSLDSLRLCLLFIDENILWDKKISSIKNDCLICSQQAKNTEIPNLKIICNDCSLLYHADCLVENSGKTINDSNNNSFIVKFFKTKSKFLCSSCNEKSIEKLRTETQQKLQEIDDKVSELNTIKINRYSLRLNKQRVTNLDKSSSEESIDVKAKKRKNKEKKSEESAENSFRNEIQMEEIDVKRARLGLRIRPKSTKRML